jgi:fatty acyl-CoA reductase
MGKVLVEKLLYSCSDLKAILLLMRPKKGKSAKERVELMVDLPVIYIFFTYKRSIHVFV